jgi:hypothetical protein
MQNLKKGLSLFLAVLMIVSTSAVSFAEGTAVADTVVYNLGSQEITVGNDADRAEATPWNYKLFDANGSYTIVLEDNAFFPYEVQFKANGVTTVEWFMTLDSTALIGGRTFSVYTEQNDDTKLSQIGVWIDGQYIAAYPGSKEFTNPMFQPFSLWPLQQVNVSLDLSALNRFQFRNVQVSAILSGLNPAQTIDGGAKVAWARAWNDDYEVVGQADRIDLSELLSSWSNQFTMDLIVGTALQLDDSNIRYRTTVTTSVPGVLGSLDVYSQTGNVRSVANFADTRSSGSGDYLYEYRYLPRDTNTAQTFYLGVNLNPAYSEYTVRAIEGSFANAQAAITAATNTPALDVTGRIVNQTLTNVGTGFEVSITSPNFSYWRWFTFVIYDGTEIVGSFELYVVIQRENNWVQFSNLMDNTGNWVSNWHDQRSENGVQIYTQQMRNSGLPANAQYRLVLGYTRNGSWANNPLDYVTRAVLGNHATEQAINAQPDIKNQLFPENSWTPGAGYLGNFSGNGLTFSILAEGEVFRVNIRTIDSTAPPSANVDVPNPRSSDAFFYINGVDGVWNRYILPYQDDSYYTMGFQTVFLLDDAIDLSALKPTFWTAQGVNVYAGHTGNAGTLQLSGETIADFSSGPLQYSVPATDGRNQRNYWITFAKKHIGDSKLFVNGINGTEGATRRVFLNSTFNYRHDIFIANLGDEQLTGLNATLTNAQNIKLDPYWRVGGANNDVLEPFVSTSSSSMKNIGKIRLLPDGDGVISGTLTITAAGQTPVVITLTGHAGNPRLTTTDIPEAVKFVPYGIQLMHNNMYPWNTPTLRVISGTLPEGMELRANGELYGVPLHCRLYCDCSLEQFHVPG